MQDLHLEDKFGKKPINVRYESEYTLYSNGGYTPSFTFLIWQKDTDLWGLQEGGKDIEHMLEEQMQEELYRDLQDNIISG